jgi:hypothetical protein
VEVPAMTADIVERLHWDAAHQRSESETEKLEREAADEIERLRAKNHELASTIATRLLEKKPRVEIDRLRAALKEIAGLEYDHVAMVDIARIALEDKS